MNPNQTNHRSYEALLAVLVEGCSQKEAASMVDFNLDEGLSLFAGLNVLPKKCQQRRERALAQHNSSRT